MKKAKDVTHPILGMQRENFSHFLDERTYTFQLNGNLETDEHSIGLTNEHSNILCTRLKPGFKVVGNRYDGLNKRVILMLVNPETGVSEIGKIDFKFEINDIEDIEKECNCEFSEYLYEALEDSIQEETCTYTTLVSDECNKCLGFSINHPIHDIVIKTEQSGSMAIWTDRNEPYRYINLDDLDSYFEKDIPCSSDKEETCLDCEKLRVFNLFDKPTIEAEAMAIGGNLRMGNYYYKVAYCDSVGNELTSYFSTTGRVTVFDSENNVLSQPNLNNRTNFSIKLRLYDLDKRFNYYKIVVIHNTDEMGTMVAHELPVRSTSVTTVMHSTNDGLVDISLNKIFALKPIYETVDGVVSANNYVLAYGLTEQRKWNLQPVVNLLGSMVKWQSTLTTEDLYKDGANDAKYGTYMRDEVYPISIRVGTNTGYVSPLFPLVARPPREEELEEVSGPEVSSVLRNSNDCTEDQRKYRWQFYNTAKKLNTSSCSVAEIDGTKVPKIVEERAIVYNIANLGSTTWVINPKGEFEDFETWLDSEEYSDDSLYSHNNDHALINSYFQDIKPDVHGQPNMPFDETCNGPDCPYGTCETPEMIEGSEVIKLQEIVNVEYNKIERAYPSEYTHAQQYEYDVYLIENYNRVKDTELFSNYLNGSLEGYRSDEEVYYRNITSDDSTCRGSIEIYEDSDVPIVYGYSVANDEEFPRMLTAVDANVTNTYFKNKIHKNALWFSYEIEESDDDIIRIELTKPYINCERDFVTSRTNTVRYHIFDGCDNSEIIQSGIINIEDGHWFTLNRSDFGGKVIIAIDTQIEKKNTSYSKPTQPLSQPRTGHIYVMTSPCAVFSLIKRNVEYSRVDVTFDELRFKKEEVYSATCQYLVPKVTSCEPRPYEQGEFGYVESLDTYPDNQELYDSSWLKISPDDITDNQERLRFEKYYSERVDNDRYIWKNDNKPLTDFTCRGIRHYKFPDNTVSPFMNEFPLTEMDNSIIYPLGFIIDKQTIKDFLKIAVKNGLLTQEEHDSITYYEVFRGDRSLNKTVLYKGIANDMYKDPTDKNTYFRNFPYNALGDNQFLLDNRKKEIRHPYNSTKNNRFSLIAPEVYLRKFNPGTEVSIEGYMYGNSVGGFKQVDEHSKWVILGSKAKALATKLATLEVAFEFLLQSTHMIVQAQQSNWTVVGPTSGSGKFGTIISKIAIGLYMAAALGSSVLFKYTRYEAEWIMTFKNMGSPENFAQYYISTKGFYNSFTPNVEEDNKLRGIVKSVYLKPGIPTFNEDGKLTRINNREREDSLYLYFGRDHLNYPTKYLNYDNTTTSSMNSSRFVSSDEGCDTSTDKVRRIASPYFSLKSYLPNQYGTIDSIEWVHIPHRGLLSDDNCEPILGGDVRITRVDLKNKFPFFYTNAVGLGNRIPFDYEEQRNVGVPKYYCRYDTTSGEGRLFKATPTQDSVYNFDCDDGQNDFYLHKPAKFYLYSYGIPYFLVESDINMNYRYSGNEYHEEFASNGIDAEDWTQESKVPIAFNNIVKYNPVYSNSYSNSSYELLPVNYSKELYKKLEYSPNGVIYSNQDNNEQSIDNPWLVYKPYNRGHFPTSYGKLINMANIESEMVFALFENQAAVFNAVDVLRDRISTENAELGLGGMFVTRPREYHKTDLGETGTQHKAFLSTEFGHYWVDAERGKVNHISENGSGYVPISDFKKDGQESGMRKWFKKHLPFNITKVKGVSYLDVDNAYKDVGIVLWWDAKFKRVFLTKKDYKPLHSCIEWTKDEGFFINETECNGVEQDVTCPTGYGYNDLMNRCEKTIAHPIECEEGYTFNYTTKMCESEGVTTCPEGYIYNTTTGMCDSVNSGDDGLPDELIFIIDDSGSLKADEILHRNSFISDTLEEFRTNIESQQMSITFIKYATGANMLIQRSYDIEEAMSTLNTVDNLLEGFQDYEFAAWEQIYLNRDDYENSNAALIIVTDGRYYDGVVNRNNISMYGGSITDEFFDLYKQDHVTDSGVIIQAFGATSIRNITNWIYSLFSNRILIMLGTERDRMKSKQSYLDIMNDDAGEHTYPWSIFGPGLEYFPTEGNGINGLKAFEAEFDQIDAIIDSVKSSVSQNVETIEPIGEPGDSYPVPCNGRIVDYECIERLVANPIKSDIKTYITVQDREYFEDASWTLAYSPTHGTWISYYDFKPNYAIYYNGYFQTGINYSEDESEIGLWSHLLTNKSYQVFYGKRYEWTIEYPIKNTYTNKVLDSLSLWVRTYRYHNELDYAEWRNNGINKAVIYNNTNNSGILDLVYLDKLRQAKYPKTINKFTQQIPAVHYDEKVTFNYFYNRVINQDNNVPIWLNDGVGIKKSINYKAVSMTGKKVLERLRGEWFLVRLTQDKTSQFKQVFKWSEQTVDEY